MKQEEYVNTQKSLLQFGMMTQKLNLEAFLATIHTSETVGPMVDPTLFRKASGNITLVKRLAEALLHFQKEFETIQNQLIQNAVAEKQNESNANS